MILLAAFYTSDETRKGKKLLFVGVTSLILARLPVTKRTPHAYSVESSVVPVAGVEPARVISPTDFESASSANSNTPA